MFLLRPRVRFDGKQIAIVHVSELMKQTRFHLISPVSTSLCHFSQLDSCWPRIEFNLKLNCDCSTFPGVYISKIMYMREGEKSLDGFYRPWHPVEYYRCVLKRCGGKLLAFISDSQCFSHRYLRFFPSGQVIMLTTPDDPLAVVHHLRNINTRCSWFLTCIVPTW